jgi:hypothetical protein
VLWRCTRFFQTPVVCERNVFFFGKFPVKKFGCQWAGFVKAMAQIPKKDYFAVPTALSDR